MAKYIASDGFQKEVDLLNYQFETSGSGYNYVCLRCYDKTGEPVALEDIFDDAFLRMEDVSSLLYLGYTKNKECVKSFDYLKYSCAFTHEDEYFNVELTSEEKSMFIELLNATKAYVYNDGEHETVIIANNEDFARQFLGNYDAEFTVEPVKAYNTPDKMGIVVATSINSIKTNEKTNMEYWDGVDAVIEKHVAACIEELKQWSTKDIVLESNGVSKEDVIMEISKSVGDVLINRLENFCDAEFPYCHYEDELEIDNGSQKMSLNEKMETAGRKNIWSQKGTINNVQKRDYRRDYHE